MDAKVHQPISCLSKAAIFNQLSAETLARLTAGTTESITRRGGVVFGRGATATGIYVVASGQLKLSMDTPQGAEHVVELIQEDDSFGEAELLTNRPHLVAAIAVTDCKLLHVGRQTLLAELERDKVLARRIIDTLSDRLYRQTSELENVLFLKASGRVARASSTVTWTVGSTTSSTTYRPRNTRMSPLAGSIRTKMSSSAATRR